MIIKAVNVELDEHYFRWLKSSRGDAATHSEVVMVLPRPGQRILTLTKSFYPEGTYSLPSGGIEHGETPEAAFAREVAEETGLDIRVCHQIGRIEHHCVSGDESLGFVSHLLLGTESCEPARTRDASEHISGYLDASAAEMRKLAEHMRGLTGRWAGFGRFRATALDLVADCVPLTS